MWSQLAVSLQQGNPYLLTILIFGFIGCVILLERFIMLQLVYNLDFTKFLSNLRRSVQAEDLDRAVSICKNASTTSLPAISLKAIEAVERDPSSVRGVIEEETIDFLPKLETRISILPALATLILLTGVLGTIDGLWSAFDSIEILDTSEKQARLANGIAGSLNPTSMGLLISMIFLTCHQLLRGLAIKITERIHYGVSVLVNLLAPNEVATYVTANPIESAPASVARDASDDDVEEPEPTPEEEDDSFDDASVEDIKDEEEII
ncbi:MAG: MotA/TolQ/ExbB proton channel family protein [Oligoflexus sp.]